MGLPLLRRNVDREALWKAAGAGRQPVNKTSVTFKFKHVTASRAEKGKFRNFRGNLCIVFSCFSWLIPCIINSFVGNKDHQHTLSRWLMGVTEIAAWYAPPKVSQLPQAIRRVAPSYLTQCGCRGVSCLLNFSRFLLAAARLSISSPSKLSTMLTCFLSPGNQTENVLVSPGT